MHPLGSRDQSGAAGLVARALLTSVARSVAGEGGGRGRVRARRATRAPRSAQNGLLSKLPLTWSARRRKSGDQEIWPAGGVPLSLARF
eukprot:6213446-Pleurochrysis_carterae.AAC.1